MNPSNVEEILFVHLGYSPPLPLLFRRISAKGAMVIGGKTGSHRTGHSETYWDKLKEIIKLGYTPVEIAKDVGLLNEDWAPPQLDQIDQLVKEGYFHLKRGSTPN